MGNKKNQCKHIDELRHLAHLKEREAMEEQNLILQLVLRFDASAMRIAAEELVVNDEVDL